MNTKIKILSFALSFIIIGIIGYALLTNGKTETKLPDNDLPYQNEVNSGTKTCRIITNNPNYNSLVEEIITLDFEEKMVTKFIINTLHTFDNEDEYLAFKNGRNQSDDVHEEITYYSDEYKVRIIQTNIHEIPVVDIDFMINQHGNFGYVCE
jgi:hypothetical protein